MDEGFSSILLLGILISVDFFITLFYTSLVNCSHNSWYERAENGDKRAQQDLELLTGQELTVLYRLGLILVRFASVAVVLWRLLPAIAPDPNSSSMVEGLILLGIAFLTFIFGEIIPEAIGTAKAESLASFAMFVTRYAVIILKPVTIPLLALQGAILRIYGSNKTIKTVTEQEIITLIDQGHTSGTIEIDEKAMIYSVLQLDQTMAREAMVPRTDLITLDIDTTVQESLNIFIESGYSRIPVYEGNIDNIAGVLYVKDLLKILQKEKHERPKTIRQILRAAHFVPEALPADELLKDLQSSKIHLAIVIDEHGGTSGIVTIEDLLEEIVGDIQDEYDFEEDEYIVVGDDYMIDASMDLDDLNSLLDIELDTDEADSLGGYIYAKLGRIPNVNEVIDTPEVTLTVKSVEERRIRQVLVSRITPEIFDPVELEMASENGANN